MAMDLKCNNLLDVKLKISRIFRCSFYLPSMNLLFRTYLSSKMLVYMYRQGDVFKSDGYIYLGNTRMYENYIMKIFLGAYSAFGAAWKNMWWTQLKTTFFTPKLPVTRKLSIKKWVLVKNKFKSGFALVHCAKIRFFVFLHLNYPIKNCHNDHYSLCK